MTRSRPSSSSTSLLGCMVVAFTSLLPLRASADDVAGAVTGSFVLSDGDVGGGAMLDVWAPIGVLRLGGFVGVGSILSDRDERNRVMMPAGVSAALVFGEDVSFMLLGRGGVWGGATQATKLTIGAFFGGGLGLGFHLSPEVTVGVNLEIWGILGAGETWAFVPGLSLGWGPAPPPPTSEE